MRQDFDEHVDVIAGQGAVDDRHARLCADLLDDLPDPQADVAMEHLEAVLRSPHEMIAMMECRVTTALVAHSL